MLAGVTEGENTYSYTYDENGIRTSKTVNGVKTLYNTYGGMVLSQSDGTNTMYFQYNSSGKPVGFVYNGTQYYYITNALGDIVALTDANGNVFAEYIYNEWGEVLSVLLIDELYSDIANANPLRYRGYYYDNETGYYYLQSRYYDPQICRFINADSFNYINTSSRISINAYAYCENDPINFVDPTGYEESNIAEAIFKALCLAIEIDGITRLFEDIYQAFVDIDFDLDIWYESLNINTRDVINTFILYSTTMINDLYYSALSIISISALEKGIKQLIDNPKNLDDVQELIPDFKKTKIAPVVSGIAAAYDVFMDLDSGKITGAQAFSLLMLNLVDPLLKLLPLEKFGIWGTASEAGAYFLAIYYKMINFEFFG